MPLAENAKAGEDPPRRLTQKEVEMLGKLFFLPLILMIFEVKVKVVWIVRKPIVRKKR